VLALTHATVASTSRGPVRRCLTVCGDAIDTIAGVEMQAFETVDQAASDAIAMLADGERLSRLWRYVFVQMLDDYTSVLRHAGVPAAARMWAWPWWFVTDLRGLHPRALVESPSSFRRRGVFITSGALDRA
jgi:hypothetical protein